jgi:plasmid stability protein
MKNVTIALDDETYRLARIRAAELGTSLSAMVKAYLQGIASGEVTGDALEPEVRDQQFPFQSQPTSEIVPLKKPRQPGALRGKVHMADDFDEWPDDILASFEAWEYGAEPPAS